MNMKIVIRNSTQFVLITFINVLRPILELKLILFSRFMASQHVKYLIKECVGTYILHTKDVAVSRRIYIGLNDEYVKAVKAINWTDKLRGGGGIKPVLLDIGANLGHISIPLCLENYISKSLAVEPDMENYKLLKCNVILNGLEDKVILHNSALGALPNETLEFELSEDNYGDHRIKVTEDEGHYKEANRKVLKVKSTNLDSLITPDIQKGELLLWIDVQGYSGPRFLDSSLSC